jgi:hypothetical protein
LNKKPGWTNAKVPKMAKGVPKPKMVGFRAGDEDEDDDPCMSDHMS